MKYDVLTAVLLSSQILLDLTLHRFHCWSSSRCTFSQFHINLLLLTPMMTIIKRQRACSGCRREW